MRISHILGAKGRNVVTIGDGKSVLETAQLLSSARVGAVVVVDRERRPMGVLSERDIVRAFAAQPSRITQLTAQQIMSDGLVSCNQDDDIDDVMKLMRSNKIRHLPVIDGCGTLCGFISIMDIVGAVLARDDLQREQLYASPYFKDDRSSQELFLDTD